MTRSLSRRPRRRARIATAATFVVAVCLGLGVAATPPASSPATAATTAETGSAVTVAWAGGNDPAVQKYQVDHKKMLTDASGADAGSGHWDDFKNLKVTVSKTAGLRDEAIVVTATGMAPTSFLNGYDKFPSNYLQLMQCWGDDPLAADFAETCQFGAWSSETGDEAAGARIGAVLDGKFASTRMTAAYGGTSDAGLVPFRTVAGVKSKPEQINLRGKPTTITGTARFYSAANSNEQPIAYVGADGARTSFTVQTAGTQPYLGCGSAQRTRCWLVIVPRGVHSGERAHDDATTLACVGPVNGGRPHGQQLVVQTGSPVHPDCGFFDNRLVVPLDFASPTSGCASGAPESRLVGSELLAEAMSSWQRGLCASVGTAYSLTTSSGGVTRDQLLTGRATAAVTANPITADTVGEANRALVDEARVRYAPVANAALTVSFVMSRLQSTLDEPPRVVVSRDIKITPRLLAKALTQSYNYDVPWLDGRQRVLPLPANPLLLAGGRAVADPEWFALGNPAPLDRPGHFVVTGPQGEDAMQALWRYIQADADAAAFLRGEPDPWGTRINPYFLPAGHPDAKGGGLAYDLSRDPIDTVPRADQTRFPEATTPAEEEELTTRYRGLQVDSVGMMPYSESLTANAARIARTDTKFTNQWDPSKDNGAASPTGGWVPVLPHIGGNRFTLGPTDAASAARFALDSAALPLPLAARTSKDDVASARTWVAPTATTIGNAARTLTGSDPETLPQIDPRTVGADAYPLTVPLYAAVNVADPALDTAQRARLTEFLGYVETTGNRPGFAPGDLPEGFAPLTDSQRAQNAAARERITNEVPTESLPASSGGTAPASGTAGPVAVVAPGAAVPATLPATATGTAAAAPAAAAAAAPSSGAQPVLGGALIAGMAGLIAAPFLLRRRTLGG